MELGPAGHVSADKIEEVKHVHNMNGSTGKVRG